MTSAGTSTLLRLSLMQQLRGKRWPVAIGLFAFLFVAGVVFTSDPYDLFGDAFIVAVVLAVHYGIAQDRRRGFDLYVSNFVRPGRWLAIKVGTTAILYACLHVVAFAAAALIWADTRLALWYSAHLFLVASLFIPLALLIEIVWSTELSGFVAAFAVFFGLTVWLLTGAERNIPVRSAYLGLTPEPGDFRSLIRLASVSSIWNTVVIAAIIAGWRFQTRWTRRPLSS